MADHVPVSVSVPGQQGQDETVGIVPPLPRIPPAMIAAHVGDPASGRALALAENGHLHSLRWDPDTGTLTGEISPGPIPCRIQLAELPATAVSRRFWPDEPGGVWKPISSECRCEEQECCVHAAALLHALDRAREQQRRERPPSPWRTVLRPLLTDASGPAGTLSGDTTGEIPGADRATASSALGLRFELEVSAPGDLTGRRGRAVARAEDLYSAQQWHLALRPLRRNAQGRWVKSGVSWRSFEYRLPSRDLQENHSEALSAVYAAAAARRSHAGGAPERIWLTTAASPLLWQALAHARDVGVEFLGAAPLHEIALGETAEVRLDLVREDGTLVLRPQILCEGVPAPGAQVLGTSGICQISTSGHVLLAPLGTPLPRHLQRLLQHPEPLRIDPAEEEEFLQVAYPRLRDALAVTSSDSSVELPATPPATLRVDAAYAEGDRLRLSWQWIYHDPTRVLPVQRREGERRTLEHEDEVLARARTVWPTAGSFTPENLSGEDTAQFSSIALDALRELDHVDVRITGTRHAYRELDGAPHIRITQTSHPGRNDWFDLGFSITIDDREIPFPTLFTALAQGRTRLLLPDRTWFSLENPAFDVLRRLIDEGTALAEWEPDRVGLGRHHLGLWEDLASIAASARTCAAFEEQTRALRNLRDGALTTPDLPQGLRATLRDYQWEGFAWLALLHQHRLGGVLADDMGLGKTLQVLTLIQHAREQDPTAPPALVIAPTSVLDVWRREAERFTPHLRVAMLGSTTRARGRSLREAAAGADLLLTSYAVLRLNEDEFACLDYSLLILDEAQFVKNRSSRAHQAAARLRTRSCFAITGTPMENSLDDLWSIFALATPGLFGTATAFRQRYTLPVRSGEHPERLDALRRRIRPFLLRRTKEQVATELPPKDEQVLTVQLNPEHRALYDAVLQRERKKVLGLIEEDFDRQRFIVFRSLTLLRMLALDPAIVDSEAHAEVPSSKLDALFDRLEEVLSDGHRVLLFSQFTSALARVAQRLEARGIPHSLLDGSTRDRAGAIDLFRSGEASVFLISLKAGGFGLTLTEADYVFLLDPWWNPAAEAQAVDRAHRIGQERHVTVYRMIAEDTIEEKVLALQQRKAELFAALTQDGAAFQRAMTAQDVRELFAE